MTHVNDVVIWDDCVCCAGVVCWEQTSRWPVCWTTSRISSTSSSGTFPSRTPPPAFFSTLHSIQERSFTFFFNYLFRSHCKFLCRYVMSLLIIMIFFFYYYIFFFLFYWFLFWFMLSEFNLTFLCNVLVQAPCIHFSKKWSRYLIVMWKEVETMRSRICYSELLLNNYQTCLVTFQILVFQSIN